MMANLKKSLATILEKFESDVAKKEEAKFMDVIVDDVTIRIDGDAIEVGVGIHKVVVDAEGVEQVTPLEDGEYVIEEKVIVVVDGVISEVKEVEEEEVEEEVIVDEESAEVPVSSDFSEMLNAFDSMVEEIKGLKSQLEELKTANEEVKTDLAKFAAQPAEPSLEVPKKVSRTSSIHDILKNK